MKISESNPCFCLVTRLDRIIFDSPLAVLTYMLKEPYLSKDALSYNATFVAEVCSSALVLPFLLMTVSLARATV
jgi:hypothetical protein